MKLISFISVIVICLAGSFDSLAQFSGAARAQPHVLIYKTRADYRKYVSIELSADKKTVRVYPDPKDIKTGSTMLPVLLHKGYLLDRTGVSTNTAFIKMTREEFSALKTTPTPNELYKLIIDKNPITVLYDCGIRNPQKNSVAQLDLVIDNNQLKKNYKKIR